MQCKQIELLTFHTIFPSAFLGQWDYITDLPSKNFTSPHLFPDVMYMSFADLSSQLRLPNPLDPLIQILGPIP